jgi:hypothetical protein
VTRSALVALVMLAAAIVAAGCGEGEITNPQLAGELADVRAATDKYKDVKVARRDGYRPAPVCLEAEDDSGGMGIHYSNRRLEEDATVDPLKPEQLLYEPGPNGGPPKLAGVEYFIQYEGQRPPEIPFGHLDGPMPGHFPEQPRHYDLHVWLYENNPDGVFEIWNPNVECPD